MKKYIGLLVLCSSSGMVIAKPLLGKVSKYPRQVTVINNTNHTQSFRISQLDETSYWPFGAGPAPETVGVAAGLSYCFDNNKRYTYSKIEAITNGKVKHTFNFNPDYIVQLTYTNSGFEENQIRGIVGRCNDRMRAQQQEAEQYQKVRED